MHNINVNSDLLPEMYIVLQTVQSINGGNSKMAPQGFLRGLVGVKVAAADS